MDGPFRVLVVDDDPSMRELLDALLSASGFEVWCAESGARALHLLERPEGDVDVIVSDLRMDGMDGLALCENVVRVRGDVPIILVTGHSSFETAVAALRVRAFDYLTKPLDHDLLVRTVRGAAERRRLHMNTGERDGLPASPESILGESAVMHDVLSLVERVAKTDITVLVVGESGSGKELVAREIHRRSRRREGPFVAFNCASVPTAIAEAELFGSKKGAFTDSKADRAGLFAQAHGGTLLLDEIGELDIAVQPKLLRVLEERVFRPVGGTGEIPCDVRVLAATNRDLESEVRERRFREDLLFRLKVIEIRVPPLRDRGDDVLLLARHMIHKFATQMDKRVVGFTPQLGELLRTYPWPGNVRELRNVVERAVVLTDASLLTPADVPPALHLRAPGEGGGAETSGMVSLDELERRHIESVLQAAGGNKTLAARILGINRRTLYRKRQEDGTASAPLAGGPRGRSRGE